MFRILVVDDDPLAAHFLQHTMKNLPRRHEVFLAGDGGEALDFLHRRGAYSEAVPPDLILLDLNMPRLGGLETLVAIKNDPVLCVIPVIILSSAGSPEDVRRSYQAHANCYVQKPADLERSMKLFEAVEGFWMDFVLLPSGARPQTDLQPAHSKGENPILSAQPPSALHSGPTIASEEAEAVSRAMRKDDPSANETATTTRRTGCEEHNRLLEEFGAAVHELLKLHEQQFQAIIEGDSECQRFDLLIHMAGEKKQFAKYAYIRHVESHGCTNTNALNQT